MMNKIYVHHIGSNFVISWNFLKIIYFRGLSSLEDNTARRANFDGHTRRTDPSFVDSLIGYQTCIYLVDWGGGMTIHFWIVHFVFC